jgi:aryl-alcohol dehydrogenase-like predicted oxidoreductase
MKKRSLGRTDLQIPPLVFGGNVFGWTADKTTSFALLDRLADVGLNTIDTADIYSFWAPGNQGGESESIIGEWLHKSGKRDSMVIITKVGGPGGREKGLSTDYIKQTCEASLKRLRIETIDLYLSHYPDSGTPYEETLRAFEKLKQAGKIRWFGASNIDAVQLRDSLNIAEAAGLPRCDVLQPEYSLYDRATFEGPLRDLCVREEIGVITYFSLAQGFLSGKYRSMADLKQRGRGDRIKRYMTERGFRILAALDEVAARLGVQPAEVALAWIAQAPGITAPIASATSLMQVESLIKAVSLSLDPENVTALELASS